MDNAIPAKVHWLSIANSLVIVIVLSAMVVAILLKNLRQDLARYNRLATDEEKADDLEEKVRVCLFNLCWIEYGCPFSQI